MPFVFRRNLMDNHPCVVQSRFHNSRVRVTAYAISYNRSVRRLLALSLLLLFSFPLVSPLLALSANPEANLPVCCRRNGAHHCEMKGQRTNISAQQTAVSNIPTKCPFYPGPATQVRHHDAQLHAITNLSADLVHRSTVKTPAYAHVQIALDAAWQKRGPPAVASSL